MVLVYVDGNNNGLPYGTKGRNSLGVNLYQKYNQNKL